MSDSSHTTPRGPGFSAALRWAVLIALALVAVAYFVMPTRAQETCETWVAEMWEDEGGEVLTAANCTREAPDAWLIVNCFDGNLFVRYDLANGAERSPDLEEVRQVFFETADGGDSLMMQHQAMDGLFATDAPADGPFLEVFDGAGDLSVYDGDHFYPRRSISLEGAPAAIKTLLDAC